MATPLDHPTMPSKLDALFTNIRKDNNTGSVARVLSLVLYHRSCMIGIDQQILADYASMLLLDRYFDLHSNDGDVPLSLRSSAV